MESQLFTNLMHTLKKNSCKKCLAHSSPRKKFLANFRGKKRKFVPTPNHLTPPSEVKWSTPYKLELICELLGS